MDAPRLDQETVERLLDGSCGDAPAAPRALVRCLDAARAGPRSGELDGEAAAVDEFRAARAAAPADGSTVRVDRRGPVAGSARRRPAGAGGDADDRTARRFATLIGVKIAVATVAATLTGGVALAAVTGGLPGTTRDETAPPGPTATAAAPSPTPTPSPPTVRPTRPATGPTAGAPNLSSPAGLCVAYRAVGEVERGRALAAPPFAGLVAAAGGPDRVPGYCAGLLDGAASPGPAGPPSRARPTGHPTGPPGIRRTPAGRGSGTARPPAGGVPGGH